ncbi:excalibur calcium-binding domain-containing protein [Kitasatospora sp. NPDC092039]|uniref:excalibur calcium-binding domain-containing protein n=1 Tax=Kitasatospora sp. NPDC092039 TaxID=3364086 RepID=UPI0037F4279A
MTSSFPPPSPAPAGTRPWWRRPALIVLALVFLPPVGLVLLWTSPWRRPAKVAVSVVGGLYCLIWFAAVVADPKKPDTARPVAAATATASSPSPSASAWASPSTATAAPTPTATATATPAPTPTQAPVPAQPSAPSEAAPPKADVYFADCAAAWAGGAAPLHRGDAGYRAGLDSDGDGTACETRPGHGSSGGSGASGGSTGGSSSTGGSTGGSSGGTSSSGSSSSSGGGGGDAYYANCSAAKAAGAAPLHRGEPGYRPALDRDGNGVACE